MGLGPPGGGRIRGVRGRAETEPQIVSKTNEIEVQSDTCTNKVTPFPSSSSAYFRMGGRDACSHHPAPRTEAEKRAQIIPIRPRFDRHRPQGADATVSLQSATTGDDECPDTEQWQETQYETLTITKRKRGYGMGFPIDTEKNTSACPCAAR